ncbi:hypothetical protein G4974_12950 [[Ruminococcus] gnavus]|uniref:Uncharacterized protein n=1 Tax=Mediterraneibacter gnavus TaxID=33038 RepID=A0AAJ1ERF6_MEDGN|nr:hypothetical protein [Mediterraneibacter gnavus]MCC3678101.1 hypothetical protein [[Clostridium] nexile]MCB5494886.1 hypothetical protein [Mediterraneibacter gnavus]MCB5594153.1 hypothetical protein [Mediterraneibacter gnavus]MCB5606898.1 hypothetical protein [Mediterraneibacter gnavus]MCG4524204.1 hypothetical protein [Mediterraneibacter gnavus]
MEAKGIHVHCPTPNCNNKRLFDNLSAIDGVIEIKCRDCGKVVSIDLGRVMKGKRHIK